MQWTHEQSPIIQSEAPKLLIQAGAGSGKTTTLVGYAQHHSRLRILYLCYNKSVEIAARGRFPRNVENKTAHGLAYAVYGTQFSHKQTNNLRLTNFIDYLAHDSHGIIPSGSSALPISTGL